MENTSDNTVRQLQLLEYDILRQVKRICDENDITYYLSDGTVLGAVRHKGFIPWDDDVDVAIPRPDYDRFVALARKAFREPYAVLSSEDDAGYIFPFVKIVNRRAKVRTTTRRNEKIWYVWVDIFPLDVMPDDGLGFRLRKFHLLYRRMMYMFSCFDDMVSINRPNRPLIERLLIGFAKRTHPDRFLDTRRQIVKLNAALRKLPYEQGTRVISFMGAYKFRSMMDKSVYGKRVEIPFETENFRVPERYDEYLSRLYGDYMKLPPEDQRNQHELELIEIR